MDAKVSIDKFSYSCRLYGLEEKAAHIKSEIGSRSKEKLTASLASSFDRNLPDIVNPDAVYKIRKLKIRLFYYNHNEPFLDLSDQIAQQFAVTLAELIREGSQDIRIFFNNTDYIATFIQDLTLSRAWDTWVYAEYSPLRYLNDPDAITEVLLHHRHLLPKILRSINQKGVLSRLVHLLKNHNGIKLFEGISESKMCELFETTTLFYLRDFTTILPKITSSLNIINRKPSNSNMENQVVSLLFYIAGTYQQSKDKFDDDIWKIAYYVFFTRHIHEIERYLSDSHTDILEEVTRQSHSSSDETFNSFLTWVAKSSENVQAVRSIMGAIKSSTSTKSSHDQNDPEDQKAEETPHSNHVVYVKKLGFTLLIPVVCSLRLHEHYSNAFLRSAICTAMYEDSDISVLEPAWLRRLISDNDRPIAVATDLPEHVFRGLTHTQITALKSKSGKEQIAQLLLYQFAARLTGMQLSSNDYIRQQFLDFDGRIDFDEHHINITINPIPLFIVLRMAGFANWQDHPSWSEKKLSIEVRE